MGVVALGLAELELGLAEGVARGGLRVGGRGALVGRELGLGGGEVRLGDLELDLAFVESATARTSPALTMAPTWTATLVTGQVGVAALLFEEEELDAADEAGCEADPKRRSYVVEAATLPLATTLWVTSRRVAAAVMYWPVAAALDGGRTPVATRTAPTPTTRSTTTTSRRRDLIQGPRTTATIAVASLPR